MRFSKYEIEDLISQFDIPINTIESLSEDFISENDGEFSTISFVIPLISDALS